MAWSIENIYQETYLLQQKCNWPGLSKTYTKKHICYNRNETGLAYRKHIPRSKKHIFYNGNETGLAYRKHIPRKIFFYNRNETGLAYRKHIPRNISFTTEMKQAWPIENIYQETYLLQQKCNWPGLSKTYTKKHICYNRNETGLAYRKHIPRNISVTTEMKQAWPIVNIYQETYLLQQK